MTESSHPDLRTDEAHSARVYDYVLGGKNHYPADREAAKAMVAEWPALPISMRANRNFVHRAGRYLAAEQDIRQFLDIGTGLPTSPNLHEVVQNVAPDTRVVYVDNDPIVLIHARALLTGTPAGRTAYIDADMRDADAVLNAPQLRDTLDLSRPVALCLIAMLHFVSDDVAYPTVRRLLEPLPSGSYLAISTATGDFAPDEVGGVARQYAARGMTMRLRTKSEVERFFDGLDLVEPGVTQVHHWHPDSAEVGAINDTDVAMYGGLARKP